MLMHDNNPRHTHDSDASLDDDEPDDGGLVHVPVVVDEAESMNGETTDAVMSSTTGGAINASLARFFAMDRAARESAASATSDMSA